MHHGNRSIKDAHSPHAGSVLRVFNNHLLSRNSTAFPFLSQHYRDFFSSESASILAARPATKLVLYIRQYCSVVYTLYTTCSSRPHPVLGFPFSYKTLYLQTAGLLYS